ncbi:ATP-binding protein [Streptosporangium sp. NPDC002721]|uniref:ATP-binding protein n=1 Tax=Streptosporangium sp. NPDC002721 TaxID=3366188 RepID=UPI0036BC6618
MNDAMTTEKTRASHRRLSLAQRYSPETMEPIRRIVTIQLVLWKTQEVVVDRCMVILTELCSNVRHTGDERFELTVSAPGSSVRLSVRDFSPALPVVPREAPGFEACDGRGLYLAAHYADGFGMVPLVDGKVIWAEITSTGGSGTG